MDMFLELLSCGSCVDIQHYEVYNIVSNANGYYIVAEMSYCCL